LKLSKRVNKIGISPTMKIAQQAIEMKAKGEHIIDLSVGEPDFPTPQNIKDAGIKAITENFTKYTVNAGIIDLRKAITEKLKKENGLDYTPNNILVSCGAKHSIFNAVQSIVCDGDEVIISAPYYVSYPEMVTIAHGQSVIIPTIEETGFKLTPEMLRNAITPKTKLLIICNPSNPTGSAYSREELEALAPIIDEHKFYILCDEIYEHVVYDGFKLFSIASLSEKIKERTVTINGHSKSYSMTGWRIGYAAAKEELIQAMSRYQSHATSAASSISQAAALEALLGQQESVESARKEFEQRRNYFHDAITSIKGITCYKPQGAFYLFPKVDYYFNKATHVFNIKKSFDLSMFLLHEAKVATVAGSAFGSEGHLRLSYSTSMENLTEGVKRIKEALSRLI
jgi:aspartate aminotransferase